MTEVFVVLEWDLLNRRATGAFSSLAKAMRAHGGPDRWVEVGEDTWALDQLAIVRLPVDRVVTTPDSQQQQGP